MLPKNLKYGNKIESAVARSSRVNIQPQNGTGTYVLNDTIIVNIPTRNNLVLVPNESYLKFNFAAVAGTNAQSLRWDSCGAHGLIQRIRVYHGSNLISDIDQYGLLAKILFDLQQPTDATQGKQSLLAGTRSDLTFNNSVAEAGTNFPAIVNVNSGERVGGAYSALSASAVVTIPVATSPPETYCLNLLSIVGSLGNSQYLPLFSMTSAPLRVEIQLVDNLNKAMGCMAGPAGQISITNCEYVASMIELGDSAISTIYSSLGGEALQFVVPDFRNYQFNSTIGTSNTQISFPIPAKFSSLKSIVVTARNKGTGADQFFPFSCVTAGITEYQFRLGPNVMPSKAPNTIAEMYSEVLKVFGSIGDISYQPSIDRRSYTGLLDSTTANVNTINTVSVQYTGDAATSVSGISSGATYIGIDLENYAGAPKDTIFSGYNSNTDDIYYQGTYVLGTAGQVRFDAFANFDSVVVCENNTCFVKF